MQNKQKETKSCTVYLRYPTQGDSVKLLMQLDECLQIARKNGYRTVKEFKDIGDDINPFKRNGFTQLLKYVAENQISAIVIASDNTLSTDYAIFLKVEKILEMNGVKLICTKFII